MYNAAKDAPGSIEEILTSSGGVPQKLVAAFRSILKDTSIDQQFAALALSLPSESELLQEITEADPILIHDIRSYVVKQLAEQLQSDLEDVLVQNDSKPGDAYVVDNLNAGRRAIKNRVLSFLTSLETDKYKNECLRRFREATNMTDVIGALTAMNDIKCPERELALEEFYEKWKEDSLVTLKWLSLQAVSDIPGNLDTIQSLMEHPAFVITNPNCNYSLIRNFPRSSKNFHAINGSGYEFFADTCLKIDKLNPQVSARVARAGFDDWKKLDKKRQELMESQMQKILQTEELSKNLFEVMKKTLED